MKHSKEANYDFVPSDIVLGMFENEYAFATCKYKYDKWLAPSIFKRLCGFAPHDQRDPEQQLKKTIYNAVTTVPNEPVEGFKYFEHNENVYGMVYHDEECHDMTVEDPRGFKVSITAEDFYFMLEKCGFNMENGVMTGHKFAYAWVDRDSRFKIVDAETAKFKKVKEASDKLKHKTDNSLFLTKSKLEVGKVYKGTEKMPGKYMYMGVHDIYSREYHLNALKNGSYLVGEDLKEAKATDGNTKDWTHEKHMVFYKICDHANVVGQYDPYVTRSSISKHLDSEVKEDFSKHLMHNGKPLTYENVKADMEHSPQFNMLDVKSYSPCAKELSLEDFKLWFDVKKRHSVYYKDDARLAPFELNWRDEARFWSEPYRRIVKVDINKQYNYGSGKDTYTVFFNKMSDFDDYSYYRRENTTVATLANNLDAESTFEALRPRIPTAKFMSGIQVPDLFMVYLTKKTDTWHVANRIDSMSGSPASYRSMFDLMNSPF